MISDEAVEAAMASMSGTVEALRPLFAEADVRAVIDLRAIATQALAAAEPYMLAQAWDEGHQEGRMDEWCLTPNPYRSQA